MPDTERKLEYVCLQIESLHKRLSMLEQPEFWRKEAGRQAAMAPDDPSRLMAQENVERLLCKSPDVMAWWIPPIFGNYIDDLL